MSDTTHARTGTVMPVTSEPAPSGLPTLVRNAYWHGKTMGVDEFVRDQDYHRATQQTLARLTVGSGVLCGLSVSPHGPSGAAVSTGAALDGHGRLVVVDRDVVIDDLGRWICGAGSDEPPSPPGEYVLCVLLHECPVLPAPVLVTDCDTRMECRPGAVAERFRFEARRVERPHCAPACSGCMSRSSGRGRCGCAGHGRTCAPDGDECVSVAWFHWDGTAATGLTTEGRSEITSLRRLGAPREQADALLGPRLVGLWPRPGQTLDRDGAPSEWGRWRYRPRLELCFDQPVNADRVDDPDDWIRTWVVVPAATGPEGEAAPAVVRRVRLRALPGATTTTDDGQTLVFAVDTDATVDAVDDAAVERGFSVVVVARASADTGPAGAGAVSLPAQLEYAGTGLTLREVERLWSSGELPDDGPDRLVASPAPACFGDGYDGGLLHAAFAVAPVGDGVAVTGVSPHNGARVRSPGLPRVELSSTAAVDALAPRAWLVGVDGSVTPLVVGATEPLGRGASAGARSRYAAGFDTTLDAELATTVAFSLTAPAAAPTRGRVLVVTPAGAFAGTCLTEAEVADAYAHGLPPRATPSVRPSSARMPRAGTAGAWIHWTFAWEQTDDLR